MSRRRAGACLVILDRSALDASVLFVIDIRGLGGQIGGALSEKPVKLRRGRATVTCLFGRKSDLQGRALQSSGTQNPREAL